MIRYSYTFQNDHHNESSYHPSSYKGLIVIDYTPHAVHFIPTTHVFCSWKLVAFNLAHLFISLPSSLPSDKHLVLWIYNSRVPSTLTFQSAQYSTCKDKCLHPGDGIPGLWASFLPMFLIITTNSPLISEYFLSQQLTYLNAHVSYLKRKQTHLFLQQLLSFFSCQQYHSKTTTVYSEAISKQFAASRSNNAGADCVQLTFT